MIRGLSALYHRNSIVRMNRLLLIFFCCIWILSGCNIFNGKEQVPTYLHLEPFTFLNPDSNVTGSSSHNIPSVWVYDESQPVGVFDLPCTVPVLISKTSKLSLFPAVTNQGLKSYVFQYPFYTTDTVVLELNPGKIQQYTPKTRYSPGLTAAAFRVKINFEEGPGFDKLSGDTTLLVEKSSDRVFEGSGSGAIYLNETHKMSENKSRSYFGLPSGYCYLELDYHSTIPFQVGLRAEKEDGSFYSEYLAGFNPNGQWTKIYIDLASFANRNRLFTKFYLTLRSDLNDFNGKYKEGYVLFDNIKVISR